MQTAERLVAAAATLLDEGGQAAVTLRAVATACDVSHNAPYKHFASRDELLASVATGDFAALTEKWRQIAVGAEKPRERLLDAFDVVIDFSRDHPARYRLLFGTPDVAARGGDLGEAAETALRVFSKIVTDCQHSGTLPPSPSHNLSVLLFATAHGLIDADAGGRFRPRTGWPDVRSAIRFHLDLIAGEAKE